MSAACLLAAANAQAAAVAGPFNITVNLTALCTMSTIAPLNFGTYVAFQGTTILVTTPATISCTRGLPSVTAEFDTTPGIGAVSDPTAVNASGAGVINGLQYDLNTTRIVTAGTAATAASIGTATTTAYTIRGTMVSGQAGTAPGGSVTTQARTFTVTY